MPNTRRFLSVAANILVPLAILGWLVYRLLHDDPHAIGQIRSQPKDWVRLGLGLAIYLTAVMLTFARWFLLVRALRLPFRLVDAVRLGFVGYVLQFVTPGLVGGDLIKAVIVARQHAQRRPEAVATILVDRLVGFLGLLILACPCVVLVDTASRSSGSGMVKTTVFVTAGIGVAIFTAILATNFTLAPLVTRWRGIPWLRGSVLRVQQALDYYRHRRSWVVLALAASVLAHIMQATGLYLAATSIFPGGPAWLDQLAMWVVACAVGALPISPAGLGTFDYAYTLLYDRFAPAPTMANEGFLVAILYRLMCLVVAVGGVVFYWTSRREYQAARELTASAAKAEKVHS